MEKQQMKWNSDQQAYFGTTSDGKNIRVEGHDLPDPDTWQTCIGANQNVSYV